MAIIGYARVSTTHQKLDSQVEALKNYGVDHIYTEHESGRKVKRAVLEEMLSRLEPGDTLVIFKLDRLARGTKQLILLLEEFNQRHINFVSIQNHIDTSTAMGRMIFTIMSAVAEMEAELIKERVIAGLEVAKNKGVQLGRPPLDKRLDTALALYESSEMPVSEIAERCQLSKGSIYRHIHLRKITLRESA